MLQASESTTRPRNGRTVAFAAALLCAGTLDQPNLAHAGPHLVGGGFGGFHREGLILLNYYLSVTITAFMVKAPR